ncbi:MAG: 5-formyltetrahydrofolate cyclo-ligase [Alphaproteobacteria bacterium]|nr:5-formyltetrahydrofolate cyclo-ligase [Alphaproteobacteria bacterium]
MSTSDKRDLRTTARTRRAGLARATPDLAARLATFAADIDLPPCATVGGYSAISDEADPRRLMMALLERGHTLALPRMIGRTAPLAFHIWKDSDVLRAGVYGIAEPVEGAPVARPDALLVPLLAFDADGHRLGYGGGYYDRTLRALRAGGSLIAIGVAYAGQEVTSLPVLAHDEGLDAVLTERGLRRFRR